MHIYNNLQSYNTLIIHKKRANYINKNVLFIKKSLNKFKEQVKYKKKT